MVSRLGIDGPEDERQLAIALEITKTFKSLTDELRWPGPEGSEVSRLDEAVHGDISVTDTLVSSQRTARATILHLSTLLEEGMEPRASVALTLSRAALLSAGRIIYILGPSDPAVRVRNAERVVRSQASSQHRALKAFGGFSQLSALQAPDGLVSTLEETLKALPAGNITDTEMIRTAGDIIIEILSRRGDTSTEEVLREHLEWMWNVWSGAAHGWAWPKYVPGLDDPNHDVAPGNWVLDFVNLAMITHLAFVQLAASFRPA